MPHFLTTDDVYRVLQRELPEGVYPDGAPSAFFSTADMHSVGSVVSDAYTNLSLIYDNFWPATSNDKIGDWEIKVFGSVQDTTLLLSQRIARVLAKVRSTQGITKADMLAVVYTVLDASVQAEIIEWGCIDGSWMLGESHLGVGTFLCQARQVDNTGAGAGPVGNTNLGATALAQAQSDAYTYEVRVYGHTLTTSERALLEALLSVAEPARCAHVITDNLNPNDMIGGTL